MRRARRTLAAALMTVVAVSAASSGCTAERANDPRVSEDNSGTVGVASGIFTIPVDQRKAAPELSGRAVGSDTTVNTADYAGKIVVLNVWGSWCGPCRAEATALEEASKATSKQTQFVGINTRDFSPAAPEAFQRAQGITYPSIYDPSGQSLLRLGGQVPPAAIPSTLVLDRQGRVAIRVLGAVTQTTLTDMVGEVAAGR